ncbi:MAG: SDR family oxidoreductase [Nostoc sp. ChiQUE01a]|uniref:SDR family oxidoreductase n=1 Tax=Nostoc sp. CCY 9925 TaxID=3103865 RepID=UPI002ADACDA3|nr:SDR family oxidoreductase [Nostoc sp. ChiQUE01a]
MSKTIENKVALVTGANRGIGKAIAIRLAKEGALVAVHYGHDSSAAEAVVSEIKANGGSAFTIEAKLDTLNGVHLLYESLDIALKERTGSINFDILVNNAGICPRAGTSFEETTEEIFDQVFAVNVKAPFFLIQQALPRLRDGGRIINISSVVTRIAFPDNVAAYCLTKGAINTLSLVLAAKLGLRNITVNSLAPGVTDTDINASWLHRPDSQSFVKNVTALGRVGEPEDIADVAAFLASPDGRWVTGQYLEASGGFRLFAWHKG